MVQGARLIRLRAARSGLPPALVALKAGLEAAHAGLPRENPGSRWPKATLGMLGDARRLLPDQLARLNALCACAPPPAMGSQGSGLGLLQAVRVRFTAAHVLRCSGRARHMTGATLHL